MHEICEPIQNIIMNITVMRDVPIEIVHTHKRNIKTHTHTHTPTPHTHTHTHSCTYTHTFLNIHTQANMIVRFVEPLHAEFMYNYYLQLQCTYTHRQ